MATKVKVISGDITRVSVDALITAINSGGMWFGGIDGVINRVAGNLFHSQAAAKMPLRDGQTVVACNSGRAHDGAFKNVVFVVDDLKQPLRTIIYNGLIAASSASFKTVSLPTIRIGVMLGVVEKSASEAVSEMAKGVSTFLAEHHNTPLEQITFVVYRDPDTHHLLESALNAH